MNYKKYLFIFDVIFVICLVLFFYTKNSLFFFSAFPFYVGTGFSQYIRQKERLEIQTKKIITLLKWESAIYWIGMLILFILIYYMNIKVALPFNHHYVFAGLLVIFLFTFAISSKRRKLMFELLQTHNFKDKKKSAH